MNFFTYIHFLIKLLSPEKAVYKLLYKLIYVYKLLFVFIYKIKHKNPYSSNYNFTTDRVCVRIYIYGCMSYYHIKSQNTNMVNPCTLHITPINIMLIHCTLIHITSLTPYTTCQSLTPLTNTSRASQTPKYPRLTLTPLTNPIHPSQTSIHSSRGHITGHGKTGEGTRRLWGYRDPLHSGGGYSSG